MKSGTLNPLQRVLRAEADAQDAIARASADRDAAIVAARSDAHRIRERAEARTRRAIEAAERRCVDNTIDEVRRLDRRASRDLDLDPDERDRRLQQLVTSGVDRIWPKP